MPAVTDRKARYTVSLEGFQWTAHVGPDGLAHLAPVHRAPVEAEGKKPGRPGYDTRPEKRTAYTVEAWDAQHAESVFAQTMGILGTSASYTVEAA